MKKVLVAILALAMATLSACGGGGTSASSSLASSSNTQSTASTPTTAAGGKVYFLNFKPEQNEAYIKIAQAYTAATGVAVKVVTAAAGTYETQLKSEIAKRDAPTIFQVNGPVGYANWKDYTADLKDSEIYSHLTDKSLAVTENDGVYGIPFTIEGYGLIYNAAIMEAYFATEGAKVKSTEEINSFAKLKEVAEDMQAKKEALGIKGVFAATSLAKGEDWRWQTHLANVPLSYEFKDKKTDLGNTAATAEVEFKYSAEFKNLFDLYINNSTTDKSLLGSKTVVDSMSEFALGQCAMVQNGNWAYGQVSQETGNVVTAENIGFLPLYIGAPDESKQGICIGTENFFCINKTASPEDQQASLDFLNWLYTSSEGKTFVTKDLGFIAPFDSFTESDKPQDPLGRQVTVWAANTEVNNIPWNFTIFPSQNFKDSFGTNLLQYAQGTMNWDDVVSNMKNDWKIEKSNAA